MTPYVYLAAIAAFAAGGGWLGWQVRDASALREQAQQAATARHAEQADRVNAHFASKDYQLAQASSEQRYREGNRAFVESLQAPTQEGCPALADLPVPAATLRGLRDVIGDDWPGDRSAAGGPGAAVPPPPAGRGIGDRDGG